MPGAGPGALQAGGGEGSGGSRRRLTRQNTVVGENPFTNQTK